MKRAILTVVGFAVACLIAACGPRVSALFHDPNFTPESMWSGRMAILGVVAVPRVEDSEFLSSGFATRLLQRHVRERRPDLPLIEDGAVSGTLDIDALAGALEHYRSRGSLSPAELTTLSPLATQAQYGILSRIDTNLVELKADQLEELDNDSVRSVTEYDSIRHVGATFDVYDLSTQGLVWTAYVTVKRDHQRRVEHGERGIDEDRGGVSFSNPADAPDAPELAGLLENLFRRFADQLPKR